MQPVNVIRLQPIASRTGGLHGGRPCNKRKGRPRKDRSAPVIRKPDLYGIKRPKDHPIRHRHRDEKNRFIAFDALLNRGKPTLRGQRNCSSRTSSKRVKRQSPKRRRLKKITFHITETAKSNSADTEPMCNVRTIRRTAMSRAPDLAPKSLVKRSSVASIEATPLDRQSISPPESMVSRIRS